MNRRERKRPPEFVIRQYLNRHKTNKTINRWERARIIDFREEYLIGNKIPGYRILINEYPICNRKY